MLANQSLYNPEVYSGSYWPKITYHYSRTWTAYQMPMHWHASVEIMYMFMGRCSVFVQTEENSIHEIVMKSGDFMLLDSYVIHRLFVEKDTFCYMLNLEVVFEAHDDKMFTMKNICKTCDAFAQVVKREKPVLTGHDISGELYRALNVLQNTYMRVYAQPDNRCIFDAEMAVFLIQLGSAVTARRGVSGLSVHVRKALQSIENHFDSPLTIADLAADVGVHPTYLQRVFRSAMNMTINQYLTRLRIDKAARLLESANHLPMQEIARLVGFKSRQHFAQCFKKIMMITPQEYRKEQHRASRVQHVGDTGLVAHYGQDHPDFAQGEGAESITANDHIAHELPSSKAYTQKP